MPNGLSDGLRFRSQFRENDAANELFSRDQGS